MAKYQLTEKAKGFSVIILPANEQGDKHIRLDLTGPLPDYLLQMVFERKDKKGLEYVKELAPAKAAPASKPK